MAAEKASSGTRVYRGAGRRKSEPVARAVEGVAAPSRLVDIDPWRAFEMFWAHPDEAGPVDEPAGKPEAGSPMPGRKPRSRRLRQAS